MSIGKLNDFVICMPNRMVVVCPDTLEAFGQPSAEVAGIGGLDCSVDNSLTSGTGVKEKLRRIEPGGVGTPDEAMSIAARITGREAWQITGGPPTVYRLLANYGTNLGKIDRIALGTALAHH